ncbi:Chromosome partition protein Smc [uncultured spirochete]|uniref:Chromosome partition protein Smc n=1 Tax=uncultured spirochete TaxID=156406 RepID=A0A3P3XUU5_9SPIR|nr:Chromosome partition protein Smc [uncultured spirochete]
MLFILLKRECLVYLKSLEIFGFKSFADRVRIEFSQGISALLGPNGCGKSNIVDAIKWVVGEQSAKSLRAESMEDIIFNGTENRRPLSVAEVAITISNDGGALPLDVPEIEVKRRLYRSGENEYFINGKQSKLKEVRELFWDTGIGKSAYSVMEQGRIDQVLSSKPEDRRYLFEEAAGITKHKVRAREAELKLAKTEENMRQIEGIVREVKHSYESLKVQAEKTVQYRQLKDKIFETELDLYLVRLRQYVRERDRSSAAFDQKKKEREALVQRIDNMSASMSEGLDLVNELEAILVEMQKLLYGLAVEKNGKENQKTLLAERCRELKTKIEQLQGRDRAIAAKIESLQDEEGEKEAEYAGYRARIREVEANIHTFDENISAAALSVKANEGTIRQNAEESKEIGQKTAQLRQELDTITERIAQLVDERLRQSETQIEQRQKLEAQIRQGITEIALSVASRADRLQDYARIATTLSSQERAQEIERLSADLRELSSKSKWLEKDFQQYIAIAPSFLNELVAPEGVMTQKRRIDAAISAHAERLREIDTENQALSARNGDLAKKIEIYRRTLEEARMEKTKIQAQMEAAQDALSVLRREIAGQESYRREIANELAGEQRRLDELDEELGTLEEELAEIEQKGRRLSEDMTELENSISQRTADLAEKRKESSDLEQKLQAMQQELEDLHMAMAQSETEIRNLKDTFTELYSRDLSAYETRMYEIRRPIVEIREELASLKSSLSSLGSVNLMAPEEFEEVRQRYEFLTGQYEDMVKARTDLVRITDEIRTESAQLFVDTYNRIKKNFHNMFRRLFGGGRAELRLLDADHVLESGIEIYAHPPGKKLENISLLSGGERTLTAIALLFATYMVKPSPFCFLDEIDAALDEGNIIQLVNLLREFGTASQFIVITHNKKTVACADTLLGVTMEESGITKTIAIRVQNENGVVRPVYVRDQPFEEEDIDYEEGRQLDDKGSMTVTGA